MLEGNVAITLARFLALVLIPMASTLASVVLAGWAARWFQESFSGDVAIIPIALAILAVYLLVLAQRDTADRRVALGKLCLSKRVRVERCCGGHLPRCTAGTLCLDVHDL